MRGIIKKTKDLRFKGQHPNNINVGHTAYGHFDLPVVGERFNIGTVSQWFSTSKVKAWYKKDNIIYITTENSEYEVMTNDNVKS